MLAATLVAAAAAIAAILCCVDARAEPMARDVYAQTAAGWVAGVRRRGVNGTHYASFRGVPYAKQPLGELRFKELQPLEPWDYLLDASEEGPICPQHDVFYGRLMQPQGMSESCIHANIHVPLEALPWGSQGRLTRDLQPPYHAGRVDADASSAGLPILVFVHGGGFAFGSGDGDLHGPEYLVSRGIIVITFNYRLNVFGFLSLNSRLVPGNAGLRDMVTLLRWVRANARHFGGDPDDITVAGQSASASAAHLLTMSRAADGLFKRAILMSGTAIPTFYTTSPLYAQYIAKQFLTGLGINSTDPEDIHRQLVDAPLQKIMAVNKLIQDQVGLGAFFPVVESLHPGVTPIIEEDPELMLAKGRGNNIPLLVGYTSAECESFRRRFIELDILERLKANPLLILSPNVIFSVLPEVAVEKAKKVQQRYFAGATDMNSYVKSCSDTFYEYPALKVARYRQATGGAPMFLYRFAFEADYSPVKEALGLNFSGAGHVEDLAHAFRVHSVPVAHSTWDDLVKGLMTSYVTYFIWNDQPTGGGDSRWRPVDKDGVHYQSIQSPTDHHQVDLGPEQLDILTFFDGIYKKDS